jgi:hypothetical protein
MPPLRLWPCFFTLANLTALGCASPDGTRGKLLDESEPKFTYRQLYVRARAQSGIALEAFYSDSWLELEDAAKAIEQAARLMPKSDEIPERVQDRLATESDALRRDSLALAEAARSKNPKSVNEIMQRIQLTIRELKTYE